jgi:hypothetical protein
LLFGDLVVKMRLEINTIFNQPVCLFLADPVTYSLHSGLCVHNARDNNTRGISIGIVIIVCLRVRVRLQELTAIVEAVKGDASTTIVLC